jgi:uncharacterized OB-fold protein
VREGEMKTGTVYTETVVHIAPDAFKDQAPYQVAIISFDDGTRVTARIEGERVAIGDAVVETHSDEGVCFFRKCL